MNENIGSNFLQNQRAGPMWCHHWKMRIPFSRNTELGVILKNVPCSCLVWPVLGERHPSPQKIGPYIDVPNKTLNCFQGINPHRYRLVLESRFQVTKFLGSRPQPDATTKCQLGDKASLPSELRITLIPYVLPTTEHDRADKTHSSVFSHKTPAFRDLPLIFHNIFMPEFLIKGNLTLPGGSWGTEQQERCRQHPTSMFHLACVGQTWSIHIPWHLRGCLEWWEL